MRSLGKLGLLFALAGAGQLATASTYNYSFDTGSILSALTAGSPAASQVAFYEVYIKPLAFIDPGDPLQGQYAFSVTGASAPIPASDSAWRYDVTSTDLEEPSIEAPYVRFTWDPNNSRLAAITAVNYTDSDLVVYTRETGEWIKGYTMDSGAKFGIQITTPAPLSEAGDLTFQVGAIGGSVFRDEPDPNHPGQYIWETQTFLKDSAFGTFSLKADKYGSATPEPASVLAAAGGLISMLLLYKRRRHQ